MKSKERKQNIQTLYLVLHQYEKKSRMIDVNNWPISVII